VQYSAAGPTLGWGCLGGVTVDSLPLDANHTNIIEGTAMTVIAGELAHRLSVIDGENTVAVAPPPPADVSEVPPPITVDRKAESNASPFLR
jgi:hypothetical protein